MTLDLTFGALVTPEGIAAAAAVITAFVALLKYVFPVLDAQVSGARQAFFLTGILYALAAIAIPVGTPDAALRLFIAWLACATAAVGIHSTVQHVTAGRATGVEG